MRSYTTERFRKAFAKLPKRIQKQAKEAYKLFKKYPHYPSLHFKRIHSSQPIYSVRVNIDYRAIGVLSDKEIVWFWIGSHSDYDQMLSRL